MPGQFQLVAGHVALDFANTLDNRYNPERSIELLSTYECFLAFASQSGVITGQQERKLLSETSARDARHVLDRVIELRESLHSLFRSVATGRPPDRSCLQTFNRFLADTRVQDVIVWRKPDFVVTLQKCLTDRFGRSQRPPPTCLSRRTVVTFVNAARKHAAGCSSTEARITLAGGAI